MNKIKVRLRKEVGTCVHLLLPVKMAAVLINGSSPNKSFEAVLLNFRVRWTKLTLSSVFRQFNPLVLS